MKKIIYFLLILFLLPSCEKDNAAPKILDIVASAMIVDSNGTLMFNCEAEDAEGDPILYRWSCLSGSFTSSTTSSFVSWQAPSTDTETISRITVEVADEQHPFDTPFSDEAAIMINVDPIIRCKVENFGTVIVKNTGTLAIRVQCAIADPSCPLCVPIYNTPVVALTPGQSTTFEMKPGSIIAYATTEAIWQLGNGGPWWEYMPVPLAQCETINVPWGFSK